MRGEIENANDSLIAFNTLVGQVQRTKKQYQQGAEHVAKAQEKLSKALADPTIHAKTKQHVSEVSLPPLSLSLSSLSPPSLLDNSFFLFQLESKVKQAQTWMETMSKYM